MKKRIKKTIALSGAILALAIAAPAFAQYDNHQHRQYNSDGSRSFPTNYPWFSSNVPQGAQFEQYLRNHPNDERDLASNPGRLYDPDWRNGRVQLRLFLNSNPSLWRGLRAQGYGLYNQSFINFLANHRNVAYDLRADPDLIYDSNYVNRHGALRNYLASHHNVWQSPYGSNYASGDNPNNWGAYDANRQWRDAYWWHDNDPDAFYGNHPEWASLNPEWRDRDGVYDKQHQWHYGQWWYERNPSWVMSNRPNWVREHRNWENRRALEGQRSALEQQRQQDRMTREQYDRDQQLRADQNRQDRRDQITRDQLNQQDRQQQALRDERARHYLQQQSARDRQARDQQIARELQVAPDQQVVRDQQAIRNQQAVRDQQARELAARQQEDRNAANLRNEHDQQIEQQHQKDNKNGQDNRGHGNGNGNGHGNQS